MREQLCRYSLLIGVTLGAGACRDSTSPTLAISGPPDFVAVVTSSTHRAGASPGGSIDQYEVWVAVYPSTVANAGVIVGASRPVFERSGGVLRATTPADIKPGDTVEVWGTGDKIYGSAQAPPGSWAYFAAQIVIARSQR